MASLKRTHALAYHSMQPGVSLKQSDIDLVAVDYLTAVGWVQDERGSVLVRAEIAGEDIPKALREIRAMSRAIFKHYKWRVYTLWDNDGKVLQSKRQTMDRFAKQVFAEIYGDRCAVCKGRGYSLGTELHAAKLQACRECGGSGRVKESSRARARALGLDHTSITRTWGVRIDNVIYSVRDWQRRFEVNVARRL